MRLQAVCSVLIFLGGLDTTLSFTVGTTRSKVSSTQLSFFRKLFKRGREDATLEPPAVESEISTDVCIIGGGVSGLVAASEAAKAGSKVILLEADSSVGGRVQSDKTDDGFTLDRGFAVFIEKYPMAQQILDYDDLKLKKFLPGALVKVEKDEPFARVADPFRQPLELATALTAPVGSFEDKLKLLAVIAHAVTCSVEELFEEEEKDTETELTERWDLSPTFVDRFFRPFLEGIYLAPLNEQSSRMFSFVFKMFSEGAATLPAGGMGAVSEQLARNAKDAGTDIRTDTTVTSIQRKDDGEYLVMSSDAVQVHAKSIIVATDSIPAQKLLSQIEGLESFQDMEPQTQRQVMCMYYGFDGEAPIQDPILILNGVADQRGPPTNPVNNICFPSVVNEGYAPKGKSLCSVTVLKDAMDAYEGRDDELDKAVRSQLSTWFPEIKRDIDEKWELKGSYRIKNAQPAQLGGPFPASANGGRPSNAYRGDLPEGLLVCGDHMATATLNGALESGLRAGQAAAKILEATN